MDMDYIDQLSESEKNWLNKFMKEELNASLSPREDRRKDFNKTLKDRKRIWKNNNARNSCAYTITDSNTRLDYIGERVLDGEPDIDKNELEDRLIAVIDKRLRKKLD